VTELRFRSFQREDDFAVRARCFVLCLGGIENPRALLNTPGAGQHALGNEHDLVGRNFCEHLHYGLGSICSSNRSAFTTWARSRHSSTAHASTLSA
jgi:choline dehydrogenase-like flavoprotein